MTEYNPKEIEQKWQSKWQEAGTFEAKEDKNISKTYVLDMFPYPSGEGLHVGHPKGYIATDIYSRYMRMKGKNVLHAMGWDAFGLPAENYAIKNKVHPKVAVDKNVARYKEQLSIIGFDYDWKREINTTDPKFYKWTQWIFLKLLEKGLAYESYEPINWCPSCQTGLANEDLEDGRCERCGSLVEKKPMRQWVLRITAYADKLLEGLGGLDWPDSIKESQRNWIGRSEGAEIDFLVKDTDEKITVFTTRIDTIFGATYVVIAPENKFIHTLEGKIENAEEVRNYVVSASKKEDIERTAEGKEKTGVELKGIRAINPATKEEIPVFVADYVLGNYGTGAVMAVPAHDERDFEFANKFNLDKKIVVHPAGLVSGEWSADSYFEQWNDLYSEDGNLVDSGKYNGQSTAVAREAMIEEFGKKVVKYKLREWVFSRQRYWGEPIPVVHCEKDGIVPVPEQQLPVTLPAVESYEPTGTGESPLANIDEWVNTTCPKCDGPAKRETNTMPQWAGSSWYYLRYMDPQNEMALVGEEKEKYWAPVDMYVGGAEHATRHLIYARFWHKFLFDIGVVSTDEPFKKLHNVGLILGEDGQKMSKRYGNVVNPDDVVSRFGADTLRCYEMFMGPFGQAISWNTDGMVGVRRFLEKVWRVSESLQPNDVKEMELIVEQTIKKVGEDIENFRFNTAISSLMILFNEIEKNGISKSQFLKILKVITPFAPHLAEELWQGLGNSTFISEEKWPEYNQNVIESRDANVAVQVNGKVRGIIKVSAKASQEDVLQRVKIDDQISKKIEGLAVTKVIYVPGKVINLIVS